MELKDTAKLMDSKDYKDRFLAEYYQLKIRYEKLQKMYDNWENLDFTPACPKNTYLLQLKCMKQYLVILEERSVYEDISLESES